VNITHYFRHWKLTENPFCAEEARQDAVFTRLSASAATHPDFEKIIGDLSKPATSIVFGEKGSGKTAIRLQMAQRLDDWNETHPDARALLIAYDDLNPPLDRFWTRQRSRSGKSTDNPFTRLKLTDHMDAILQLATTQLVDRCVGRLETRPQARLTVKAIRQADPSVRRDFMILQSVYDQSTSAPHRTRQLRAMIRGPRNRARLAWSALAWVGWIAPAAVAGWLVWKQIPFADRAWLWGFGATLGAWGLVLAKRYLYDEWRGRRVAKKIARQIRVLDRSIVSWTQSLSQLPRALLGPGQIPIDGGEDVRFEMFHRLYRLAEAIGYSSVIIVVDRIDEPTSVSGDPDRMRAVVWPMLSNKFLQMEGFGFKLLLPIELRYALFRESSSFFQEARLDKQNLIEQLVWTGATLYDLCAARLRACRAQGAGDISLSDLFDDDVRPQDVVDALDQMRQPRDAFKLLYQCIQEYCANITEDAARSEGAWRIPRLILETVRRQQADRVGQLQRGMRPA